MDFLDSLESSLKSLEAQEERDPAAQRRQQDRREQAAAIAPWAEKLKNAPYTKSLFEKSALISHRIRAKIYMAWLESTLRLEARGRWCELRPTATGIEVEYLKSDGAQLSFPLSLDADPQDLLSQWLELPDQEASPAKS